MNKLHCKLKEFLKYIIFCYIAALIVYNVTVINKKSKKSMNFLIFVQLNKLVNFKIFLVC